MRRLNIVTIASVFPNPYEPILGVFVEARQRALAKYHDVHVVVPIGVFDYSGHAGKFRGRQSFPGCRREGIAVTYLKWIYLPGGTLVSMDWRCLLGCYPLSKLFNWNGQLTSLMLILHFPMAWRLAYWRGQSAFPM